MNQNTLSSGAAIKILIIRLSSIGDILLCTPFIRQVRNTFPQARIDFIIKDNYKDLLEHNPHINELYSINITKGNKALYELKQKLNKNRYHIIFDLHNNLRSNYLKRHLNADTIRTIKKSKVKQSLLVWFKINRYKNDISIPERYHLVGKDFELSDDGKGLELFWDDDIKTTAKEKSDSFGIELNKPIIALAPGAGFFTKRWPQEKFKHLVEIIMKRDMQIVILGGVEDEAIGAYLQQRKKAINLCGQLNLLETAYFISKSRLMVSNDSGLMHMATAVKTPVVAIFGSTVKELGFFPYRSESRVIENNEVSCRPCSHIGRHKCPKGHFKCMEEITPEQVYDGLKRFL